MSTKAPPLSPDVVLSKLAGTEYAPVANLMLSYIGRSKAGRVNHAVLSAALADVLRKEGVSQGDAATTLGKLLATTFYSIAAVSLLSGRAFHLGPMGTIQPYHAHNRRRYDVNQEACVDRSYAYSRFNPTPYFRQRMNRMAGFNDGDTPAPAKEVPPVTQKTVKKSKPAARKIPA